MKNSKGISLIALIITIIVIIILAAIVIGGVFNTPNDAKFANFCQQYDELQTQIQLKYYDLYQKAAIENDTSEVPTRYELYRRVAKGEESGNTGAVDTWYDITFGTDGKKLVAPTLGNSGWYLRSNDGKLAYTGFQKAPGEVYYTPNVHGESTTTAFSDVSDL